MLGVALFVNKHQTPIFFLVGRDFSLLFALFFQSMSPYVVDTVMLTIPLCWRVTQLCLAVLTNEPCFLFGLCFQHKFLCATSHCQKAEGGVLQLAEGGSPPVRTE